MMTPAKIISWDWWKVRDGYNFQTRRRLAHLHHTRRSWNCRNFNGGGIDANISTFSPWCIARWMIKPWTLAKNKRNIFYRPVSEMSPTAHRVRTSEAFLWPHSNGFRCTSVVFRVADNWVRCVREHSRWKKSVAECSWRATGSGGGDVFGACMSGKNISGYTFFRNQSEHDSHVKKWNRRSCQSHETKCLDPSLPDDPANKAISLR